MILWSGIKIMIARSVWITVALFAVGFALIKIGEMSFAVNLLRRLSGSSLNYNTVENTLTFAGWILLFGGFGAFVVWAQARGKQMQRTRKNALRQIATGDGWQFSEYPTGDAKTPVSEFFDQRARLLPPHLHNYGHAAENFLSKRGSDGALRVVFDYAITGRDSADETFTVRETAYLIVSENLNLPYFQIHARNAADKNASGGIFENIAGNERFSSARPQFFAKYSGYLEAGDAARILSFPALEFFEQTNLYRIIGDGKTLALVDWQTSEPQANLHANLQNLERIYNILKAS